MKSLKQELIENYAKGSQSIQLGILCVGAEEMVRFIRKYMRRKNK